MTTPDGVLDALGFDPTPGDPDRFEAVVAALRISAQVLAEATLLMNAAGRDALWRGQAAAAFGDLVQGEIRPLIEATSRAFDTTLRVSADWQDYLITAQQRTRYLARQAGDEITEIARHQQTLDRDPTDPDARRFLLRAEDTLNAIRSQARHHRADFETRDAEAARALADAIDAAPNEPGLFDRIGNAMGSALNGIVNLGHTIGDVAGDLLEALAPMLQFIGDLSSALGAVLGVLAFVPGLQFLGPIALGLGIAALITHYGAAAITSGSLLQPLTERDVLLDAVGVVAGAGAVRAGRAIVASAEAAGSPIRVVPQLIGPDIKVPMSYFHLARSSYAMSSTEFGYRVVQYQAGRASTIAGVISVPGSVDAVRRWSNGQFHDPATASPPAVTEAPARPTSATTTDRGTR